MDRVNVFCKDAVETEKIMSCRRSLCEVSALQYFRELSYGCYFKLNSGNHFFVSKFRTTCNPPYKFPIISCDRESAVQNGEFKLDEGAEVQLMGGKVHHNQAFNEEDYAQLLADLSAVAFEAHSSEVQVSVILLIYGQAHPPDLFMVLLMQVEVWEQVDSLVPLKKLEFVLNKEGMPFYALEMFNAAPNWAKSQMKICIPDLERCEDLRKIFAGHFWIFRRDMDPRISADPHDEIIECFKAKIEVFTVRIGVSRMKSFARSQPLRGVSMTINGGTIFHPDCDYKLDSPALHVSMTHYFAVILSTVMLCIFHCVSGSRGNICARRIHS